MKKISFNISRKARVIAGFALVLVLTGALTFNAGMAVGAADGDAGSISDPLVSKSYLDSRLNGLSGVMTKVTVSKDTTFTASEGATVIIYSGNGSVSGSGAGLVNVTAGEMTAQGLSVAKYNTYLFVDEASSIKATSDMVVFVTGTYSLTKN